MDKTSVVWVRSDKAHDDALWRTLERELCQDGDSFSVISTNPRSSAGNPKSERDVQAFIAKHSISMMVWFGGPLESTTQRACLKARIAVILLDGHAASIPAIGFGLLPAWRRNMLTNLDAVLVSSEDRATTLQKAGVPRRVIKMTGPFEKTADILPHDEDERHTIANALSVRPIWLATCVDPHETEAIWKAYKFAARRAHRLLLIVVPAGNPDLIVDYFRTQATSVTIETEGHLPRESTQVFIANGDDKMGLWYRLAPMTYIGGSLTTGAQSDPFHAAALGSGIVHGPMLADYNDNFQKLIDAQATLQINHEDELGNAVASLLSADKTAEMVAAGWDITSRGVEAMSQLTTTIQTLFDTRGG